MEKRKMIIIILAALLIIAGSYFAYKNYKKDNEPEVKLTDAEKFAEEYGIDKDNVFVYRNSDEIINILKHGTGIVYLGFPECPWCKAYVIYLNEIAKEAEVEKIYYYNILDDRKNNTDNYKELVKILGDDLQYDDEGNERIYVPDVTFVKEGKILGRDYESSKDTAGCATTSEYWTDAKVTKLKKKLLNLANKVNDGTCTDCNK